MQVTVSGKNVDVSSSLRDHVVEKLNGKIGRFDNVVTANVTLSTDRHRHIVEISLFGKGFDMHAEERESDDMYHAINVVVDRLEKQLSKARTKNMETIRKEHESLSEEVPAEESPVKHIDSYRAAPMSVEDAIKEMESKEYTFYAFHNSENGRVNVVYVLGNGGYGLVDPKI